VRARPRSVGEGRRHHLAGAAPFRPEIRHHWKFGPGREFRQVVAAQRNGFARQQCLVAIAAPGSVIQAIAGDSILRQAVGTRDLHFVSSASAARSLWHAFPHVCASDDGKDSRHGETLM
jgi:hypothetical protein